MVIDVESPHDHMMRIYKPPTVIRITQDYYLNKQINRQPLIITWGCLSEMWTVLDPKIES